MFDKNYNHAKSHKSFRMLSSDHTARELASYVTMQCCELVECFFILIRSANSAAAKFIATAELI